MLTHGYRLYTGHIEGKLAGMIFDMVTVKCKRIQRLTVQPARRMVYFISFSATVVSRQKQ